MKLSSFRSVRLPVLFFFVGIVLNVSCDSRSESSDFNPINIEFGIDSSVFKYRAGESGLVKNEEDESYSHVVVGEQFDIIIDHKTSKVQFGNMDFVAKWGDYTKPEDQSSIFFRYTLEDNYKRIWKLIFFELRDTTLVMLRDSVADSSTTYIYYQSTEENNSNAYESSDWFEHDLKGKVKSIFTKHYKAEERSGEIVKLYWEREDEMAIWMFGDNKIEFNSNGKMLSNSKYSSDGRLHSKDMNIYDENDVLSSVREWDSADGESLKITYLYNQSGLLEKSSFYFDSITILSESSYLYNEKNLVIEKTKIYDYSFSETVKYYYDSKSNLIKEEVYDNKNDKLQSKILNTYSDGNLSNSTRLYADGTLDLKSDFVYYSDGVLKEEQRIVYPDPDPLFDMFNSQNFISFYYNENGDEFRMVSSLNSDGLDKKITTYEYKYDLVGNWTYKTEYINGVVTNITEREIDYF